MTVNFATVYRALIVGLLAVLLWTVWWPARGAEAPTATNLVVSVSPADEHRVWLTFGLDRVTILQRELLEIPLWQYVASAIYVILAFYGAKLLDLLVRGRLRKWAEKTTTRYDDIVLELLRGPIRITAFAILLHIGLNLFAWPVWFEKFLSRGVIIVVAFSVTYMALRCVDLALNMWRQRGTGEDRQFSEQLFPVVRNFTKIFLVIVGVLLTLQNLGVNITGLIASLSIGGLALSLAAQDTLANVFGAISVFVDKPFKVGDRIQLDTVDGVVEIIGLRSTRVRNLEGHLVTIPNKTMGNATITNVTLRPNIKTTMNIGVTYDTPPAKLRRAVAILEEVYRAHPLTQDLIISFNRFADFSLNIIVIHWWNSTDYKAYLAGMQELNLTIKERFDREQIEFAFPTQTLYVKTPGASGGGNSALPEEQKA